MAVNSAFRYEGTRIRGHIQAGGTIAACRFTATNASGKLIACPTATRPNGVSPINYTDGDAADYHCLGRASVETDGSAAVGDALKAAADGSGKGIKDAAPGVTTAGVLVQLDAVTNIGMVELWV